MPVAAGSVADDPGETMSSGRVVTPPPPPWIDAAIRT
jgi:hypothetical protein